ncbi:MAG: hypothetical protein J6X55_14870 [Victivallales bacterium]|nr:hypothetical protein [Victivallales bacterium]
MSVFAFTLIVISALLHSSWNLVAKKNHMSVAFYTLICTTCTLIWSHVLLWTPVPVSVLPARFWVLLGLSVLSDLVYCTGLSFTYRTMEMSTAYPVMRALPILMTLMVTALLGWGEPLSPIAICGCVVLFCGCLLMPLKKFSDFKLSNYLTISMLFVLLTALGTTGYTVLDKQAQAVMSEVVDGYAKPIRSLTFYILRSCSLSSTLWLVVLLTSPLRRDLFQLIRSKNWQPCVCGLCASGTYVLVLIAMNYVTNATYVQCFRQLGLPFGLIAGIIFLKESSTLTKWLGVALILAGLTLTVL